MTHYLQHRALFPPLIKKRPSPILGIVVVIPCHDEDFLQLSLLALARCKRPQCDVEVIIVVNNSYDAPENIVQKNRLTIEQTGKWIEKNRLSHLRFHLLCMDELPPRHAGVGLARKIGMDEACYRFHKCGHHRGIIACFDADSRCDPNYLVALEEYFMERPSAKACGIYFEHPLSGCEYDSRVYDAITSYELHLRYYVHAQRWAGFPHAWQTIGSSMAVRCDAYQAQGGMNRRKAGEDFYFLQKFIPLGDFGEITTTRVIPSPRPSHRVPFGTGKAVGNMLKNNSQQYRTYHPESFKALRKFLLEVVPFLYNTSDIKGMLKDLPDCIAQFLELNQFQEKLTEIRKHTSTEKTFSDRFWRWFDAFMVMKYVHFARDHFYSDMEVEDAARWLTKTIGAGDIAPEEMDGRQLLCCFREMDRMRHHSFERTV